MKSEEQQQSGRDTGSGRTLIVNATIMYGAMAAVGAMVCHYRHDTLRTAFQFTADPVAMGKLFALALLGGGVLLVSNYLFEDLFPSYKNLKFALAKLMGGFSMAAAAYLALTSAVGEELLFRGALQTEIGILVTSVIFGLLHLGPGGQVSSWTVWTGLAGLLLGWMYQSTGSLWPPLISHFIVNLVGFLRLRTLYRAGLEAAPVTPVAEKPSNP